MLYAIDLTDTLTPIGFFFSVGRLRQELYRIYGLELDGTFDLKVVGWRKKGENKITVDFCYTMNGRAFYPGISITFTMDSLNAWFEQVKKHFKDLEPFKVQDLFDFSILVVSPDKVLWCFDFEGVVKSLKNQEPAL